MHCCQRILCHSLCECLTIINIIFIPNLETTSGHLICFAPVNSFCDRNFYFGMRLSFPPARRKTNPQLLDCPTKPGHDVTLKMTHHQHLTLIGQTLGNLTTLEMFAIFYRHLHMIKTIFTIGNLGRNGCKTVILKHLLVFGLGGTNPRRRVGFNIVRLDILI